MATSSDRAEHTLSSRRRGFQLVEVVALAALWVLFSGKIDALHLSYGVLSILFVLVLTRHLIVAQSAVRENEAIERVRWARLVAYPFWLLGQIALANLQVAAMILRPRLDIDPVLLDFRFPVDSALAKVTLGNSITLTPGTFTLRIAGDRFVVHAIQRVSAASLVDGSMQRMVAALFSARVPPPHIEYRYRFLDEEKLPKEVIP